MTLPDHLASLVSLGTQILQEQDPDKGQTLTETFFSRMVALTESDLDTLETAAHVTMWEIDALCQASIARISALPGLTIAQRLQLHTDAMPLSLMSDLSAAAGILSLRNRPAVGNRIAHTRPTTGDSTWTN